MLLHIAEWWLGWLFGWGFDVFIWVLPSSMVMDYVILVSLKTITGCTWYKGQDYAWLGSQRQARANYSIAWFGYNPSS